ncbi:MAG: TetR/AcrR family transcriptional regulator [Acidimicrobiales bacterium]
MARAKSDTRERIVDTSAQLFRRQGYHGTGVKQIVADANAPFGSLYHFFPDGKEELGEVAIRSSGERFRHLVGAVFDPEETVADGVVAFFAGAARVLSETDYADACPIGGVALEVASTNERLRRATSDVFDSWVAEAEGRFVEAGIEVSRSHDLALACLCALEGGFMLSRAGRTTEPMLRAGALVSELVRAALPPAAAVVGGSRVERSAPGGVA